MLGLSICISAYHCDCPFNICARQLGHIQPWLANWERAIWILYRCGKPSSFDLKKLGRFGLGFLYVILQVFQIKSIQLFVYFSASKTRWFAYKPESCELVYSRNADSEDRGSICLGKIPLRRASFNFTAGDLQDNMFSISANGIVHTLQVQLHSKDNAQTVFFKIFWETISVSHFSNGCSKYNRISLYYPHQRTRKPCITTILVFR